MIRMTLAEIAATLDGELLLRDGDSAETPVSGLVDTDSREIGPGDIFVAKPGEHTDGHLFVPAAVDAGNPASAAVTDTSTVVKTEG